MHLDLQLGVKSAKTGLQFRVLPQYIIIYMLSLLYPWWKPSLKFEFMEWKLTYFTLPNFEKDSVLNISHCMYTVKSVVIEQND